jgi:hypothetical protein
LNKTGNNERAKHTRRFMGKIFKNIQNKNCDRTPKTIKNKN